MATSDRKINRYASFEYEQLSDYLVVYYNSDNRSSYPLGSFIQALKHNWSSEESIIERLNRYTDLAEYKKVLFETPFEDLPTFINHEEGGIKYIAKWRLELGR